MLCGVVADFHKADSQNWGLEIAVGGEALGVVVSILKRQHGWFPGAQVGPEGSEIRTLPRPHLSLYLPPSLK